MNKAFNFLLGISILLIVLVFLSNYTAAEQASFDWVNIANITGMSEITNMEYNSNDDTLIIISQNSYHIWGIENQTLIYSTHVPSLRGNIDSEWNDYLEVLAWLHEDSDYPTWNYKIVIFDLEKEVIAAFNPNVSKYNTVMKIVDIAWKSNTNLLTVAFDTGVIQIIDISTLDIISEFHTKYPIKQISWSRSGKFLAILGEEKFTYINTIGLIDITKNQTWDISLGFSNLNDIKWSYDEKYVFFLASLGLYKIDIASLEKENIYSSGGDLFSPSRTSSLVATAYKSGTLTFFNYDGSAPLIGIHLGYRLEALSGWSIDDSYFFILDSDENVRVWTRKVAAPRPTVEILAPLDEATVSGTVTVTGRASSQANGSVQVKVGAEDWAPATGFDEWRFTFDSLLLPEGTVVVRARALDANGYSDIDTIRLSVRNVDWTDVPPEAGFTGPPDGSTVWGILTLGGWASDDHSVRSVQIKLGGSKWLDVGLTGQGANVEWRYISRLSAVKATMTVQARAYDGYLFSDVVSIVLQVVPPPVDANLSFGVEIVLPALWQTVGPSLTVKGVTFGTPVDRVYVEMDDEMALANGTGYWNATYEGLREGFHTVRAIAECDGYYSEWAAVLFKVGKVAPVENGKPTVGLLSPSPGSLVEGGFDVSGWSQDDEGVVRVEVRVNDGDWAVADGDYLWSLSVAGEQLRAGENLVQFRAYDGSLYSDVNETRYQYYPPIVDRPEGDDYIWVVIPLVAVIAVLSVLLVRKGGKLEQDD